MRRAFIQVRKVAILCHRWMGVAFCIPFAWWFVSGIFMMYWDYPSVGPREQLEHARPIDAAKIRLAPAEAAAKLPETGADPGSAELLMFDGRPAYRFADAGALVYADDGAVQTEYQREMLPRLAADWAGQPASGVQVEQVSQPDQWTLGVRQLLPLWKYTFADGQQVYVSESAGEVVQATTTSSRVFAELGAIPHWLYYTPLRVRGQLWSRVVIWASGAATVASLLGLLVGISLYSPRRKYRLRGALVRVPYDGQKRLHTILGLFFGIVTCTWAFSGMLSMEPFPSVTGAGRGRGRGGITGRVAAALRPGAPKLAEFDARPPKEALGLLGGVGVKSLELATFDGEPMYLARISGDETKLVPLAGAVRDGIGAERVMSIVARAAGALKIEAQGLLTQYDAYYADRHGNRPLPVLRVEFGDPDNTRLYIDPRSGQVVGQHSDQSSFVTRWLYHGLHSLDFPWLYNHRPLWDVVVLALMLGGLSVCVTSLILGWQVLRRTFRRS